MAYENSNQNYQRTKMQKDMIIKRLREEGAESPNRDGCFWM